MKFIKRFPLFILISLFIISFSTIDLLTEDRTFSESENKYLAKLPTITFPTVMDGAFSASYENYISDQFLLRENWISIKAASETILLKTENNDVIFGKDGYMFPKYYEFDHKALQRNLYSIDTFAAAMKAPVAVMILPSKYYPLVDYLPKGCPFVDQSYYISEINNYLSVNATIVNARDVLAINSSKYIYYRTDHHWTNYGAWLAYCQFAPVAGFAPFDYESYPIRTASTNFLGTNYSKSHKINPKPDTIEYYDFEIKKLTADEIEYDSLYSMEQFLRKDKYAAFIQGNNGLTIIESTYSEDKMGSILIIKDSFANSLIPLLTEHYNTIYAIDPRFYNYQLGYSQFAEMDFDQILITYSFETLAAPSNINYISLDFL